MEDVKEEAGLSVPRLESLKEAAPRPDHFAPPSLWVSFGQTQKMYVVYSLRANLFTKKIKNNGYQIYFCPGPFCHIYFFVKERNNLSFLESQLAVSRLRH